MRFGQMAFDPAMRPLGQLMLGDGREEPGGGPSSLSACSAHCGHSVFSSVAGVR
jgi:hypothetical protein